MTVQPEDMVTVKGKVNFLKAALPLKTPIKITGKYRRVVDPYSFFPDPDPEYDVGDQYGSVS